MNIPKLFTLQLSDDSTKVVELQDNRYKTITWYIPTGQLYIYQNPNDDIPKYVLSGYGELPWGIDPSINRIYLKRLGNAIGHITVL